MKPTLFSNGLWAVFLCSLTVPIMAQPFTFGTLAGNAPDGCADGTNSGARFASPNGVVLDSAGNLYVTDRRNHTIRKISPVGSNWVVTTIAGAAGFSGTADGANAEARFHEPRGIAIDKGGNLYVADSGDHTIRRVSPVGADWVVTTLAGTPGFYGSADGAGWYAQFYVPTGIALDKATNLYVGDRGNHVIRKLSFDGSAWVVSTIAGSTGLFGSDDGVGSKARFYQPFGVASDRAGNLYVGDGPNAVIRKLTFDGSLWVVTTPIGTARVLGSVDGTNAAAQFQQPLFPTVDASGSIFVADVGCHNIRMVAPVRTNWVSSTLAGLAEVTGSIDGTNNQARFNQPFGMAVDEAGTLFVTDAGNCIIRTIRTIGTNHIVKSIAGLAGGTGYVNGTGAMARFTYPGEVAVDNGGYVYVADPGNLAVRKVTPAGVVTTLRGSLMPRGLAVDAQTNVYVADNSSNGIVRLSPFGLGVMATTIAGAPGVPGNVDGTNSDARFGNFRGLVRDHAGNLYATDNQTIRKIAPVGPDWVVTTLAGSAGVAGSLDGTNGEALFNSPTGLGMDPGGCLYVADYNNQTVRKMTPVGTNWVVSTFAGVPGLMGSADGQGSEARFRWPRGIAVDTAGNVFVSDGLSETIRRITPEGMVSTVGGLDLISGSYDGMGSAARFHNPGGLAIDNAGKLYVADSGNSTIRIGAGPPSLHIIRLGANAVVSWPAFPPGFHLETSSAPYPESSWIRLTNGVVVGGEGNTLTTPVSLPAAFYRLSNP